LFVKDRLDRTVSELREDFGGGFEDMLPSMIKAARARLSSYRVLTPKSVEERLFNIEASLRELVVQDRHR